MGSSWFRLDDAPGVVCDAGPHIHLDELGCLDLLTDFATLWVPEEVCQEVDAHRAALTNPAIEVQRLTVAPATSPFFPARNCARSARSESCQESALARPC